MSERRKYTRKIPLAENKPRSGRKTHQLTDKQISKIWELKNAGMTQMQIKDKVGTTRYFVRKILRMTPPAQDIVSESDESVESVESIESVETEIDYQDIIDRNPEELESTEEDEYYIDEEIDQLQISENSTEKNEKPIYDFSQDNIEEEINWDDLDYE